ncbi:hypothetical protein PVAP13_3NG177298 [Panicum virgatum]|uniref:Uncharacterized protein n=1 Tax=Panicum virgatum TaxID=38727 RepID=A0A8T0U4J5_PANVG|nr:hypothetical protein PVAP13_3NG177298 [Panicum virgatum]
MNEGEGRVLSVPVACDDGPSRWQGQARVICNGRGLEGKSRSWSRGRLLPSRRSSQLPAACSSRERDQPQRGRERDKSSRCSLLACSRLPSFLPPSQLCSTTTTLSPSLLFPTQHHTTPLSLSLPVPLSLVSQIKAKEPRSEQEKKGKEKEKKRLASPRLLLGLRPASHLSTSPPSVQASMAERRLSPRGVRRQGVSALPASKIQLACSAGETKKRKNKAANPPGEGGKSTRNACFRGTPPADLLAGRIWGVVGFWNRVGVLRSRSPDIPSSPAAVALRWRFILRASNPPLPYAQGEATPHTISSALRLAGLCPSYNPESPDPNPPVEQSRLLSFPLLLLVEAA